MIKENVRRISAQLPAGVEIVAAGKLRSVDEIREAIEAGIKIVGENYVQEAEDKFRVFKKMVQWHFIGHLQKNKVSRAVGIFDMIETVDSFKIAQEIDKVCGLKNKVMPVLIEVNCAREKQKFGLLPDEVEPLIERVRQLKFIKVYGLMTMGPFLEKREELRFYFRETRQLYQRIKSFDFPELEMRYLSMGMSDSYQIAVDEGANLIRVGTGIFGRKSV